ncbi:hypothetical protein ABIA43_006676 [Bradyrhizobium sp. USDA 328]
MHLTYQGYQIMIFPCPIRWMTRASAVGRMA